MGTHKSHSKYRLAWENTFSERIPFMPLHRRDLVSADVGNRTFVQDGDKINWNKFQVMGDVLMILVRAQEMPYKDLKGNPVVEKLINDSVLKMNDDVSFFSRRCFQSCSARCLACPERMLIGLSGVVRA